MTTVDDIESQAGNRKVPKNVVTSIFPKSFFMKRIFFPLLAWGMFAGALVIVQFSQGNSNGETSVYKYDGSSIKECNDSDTSSEKWEITANTLKGSTGRLQMDNPKGSKWIVYIYSMPGEKYVTSFAESNNKGLFTISPGEYKITVNNVPVQNVPIKKGHDTKLKCGILNIVSEGLWYLNDETGKTYYTSGNKPKKMPIPVGTYSLKLGGVSQPVVVKNGEAVEM